MLKKESEGVKVHANQVLGEDTGECLGMPFTSFGAILIFTSSRLDDGQVRCCVYTTLWGHSGRKVCWSAEVRIFHAFVAYLQLFMRVIGFGAFHSHERIWILDESSKFCFCHCLFGCRVGVVILFGHHVLGCHPFLKREKSCCLCCLGTIWRFLREDPLWGFLRNRTNVIALTEPLMTHVLDRWCFDGGRFVAMGQNKISNNRSFYHRTFSLHGTLPHSYRAFWDPSKGCRIGEAQNPGPDLIVTVSNPTSMNQKHHPYQQLPGHVHCISETAMTQTLIDESEPLYRSVGFKTFWGAAVPSHRLNKCGIPTRRGTSTGVAILTKDIHSKRCYGVIPQNWHSTCRLVECMIRVSSIDIKVICLYGVQSSAQNARSNTNALLSAAMYRSQTFPGPCIVAGDFNFLPCELEAWETCSALGFVDLTQIAKIKFPHKVFPTCKDSTHHDTILVNRYLSEKMVDFCVHIDKKFDVHAPLSVTFNLPVDGLYRSTWKLPTDVSNLGLDKFYLHETYSEMATEEVIGQILETASDNPDEAYRQWAALFEKSVDQGLRNQKTCGADIQHGCLRPFHKGRGQLPKIVLEHVPISFRKGYDKNYTPNSEASNINLRQITKQVRRIQSLSSRLAKWEKEFWGLS